jgi:uncharacterized protein (TIGR03437 family)
VPRHSFLAILIAACVLPAVCTAAAPQLSFAPTSRGFLARTPDYTISLAPTGLQFSDDRASRHLDVRFLHADPHAPSTPGAPLPARLNYYLGNDRSRWRTGIALFESAGFENIYPGIGVRYHAASSPPASALEYDFHLAPGADPRRILIAFDSRLNLRLALDGSLAAGDIILQKPPAAYQLLAGHHVDIPVRIVARGRNRFSFALGAHDPHAAVVIDPVLIYSTYLGGSGTDDGYAIRVDASGSVYVAGSTSLTNFPILNAPDLAGGGGDIFVSKFDPTGKLLFSTIIGGSASDVAYDLDLDASGNILVTGTTFSTNFPVQSDVFQPTGYVTGTAFALKLKPSGEIFASTYLGGKILSPQGNNCPNNAYSSAFGISHDPTGNIYVVGQTCTLDFPTLQAIGTSLEGQSACFITELTPALTSAVYSTYLGGLNFDYCNAIAVDSIGDAYVAGGTASGGLATSGAFQTQYAGGYNYGDGFVAKILPLGQRLFYYTYLGGSNEDAVTRIAIDSAGDAYVTGFTQSPDFPLKNPLQPAYGGGADEASLTCCEAGDAFIAELNPAGSGLIYSTFFGGAGLDTGTGIAIDSTGNAYVAGATNSINLHVTSNALQSALGAPGAQNGFIIEIAPQGTSLEYSTYLGGPMTDTIYDIAANNAGGMYVVGSTNSFNFPVANAFQSKLLGVQNAFVAALGPPAPLTIHSLTNGASFASAPAVSPGSLATIFASTGVAQPASASSTPLSGNLGGVSVTINGTPAPMVFVNSSQVNFQLPNAIGAGPATAILATSTASSAPFDFTVSAAAPGIFTYGSNQAVAQNYPSLAVNAPNAPAKIGGVAIVYLTGIGAVNNPVGDGLLTPTSPLSQATSSFSATIDQLNAPIGFLGLTPGYIGLAQANLTIPSTLQAGTYPLVITVNGVSSNAALITVQ